MTATTSTNIIDTLCSPYLPFDASSSTWSDLQPTPQSDPTSPMCPILYAPTYSTAMSLYRTLTSSNSHSTLTSPLSGLELSSRALALTTHIITLNPSHFSVWQYRALILLHSSELETNREQVLAAELKWLDQLAHRNMKSYQVWQHRRIVVSALGDPKGELEFVEENLAKDAKNYHTWGYRQWVLAHFGGLNLAQEQQEKAVGSKGAASFPELWDGEVDYIDRLLQEDVRNNSAWNHRWFVLFGRYGLTSSSTTSLPSSNLDSLRTKIKYEKAYTKTSLAHVPNNASAWSYLRALHTAFPAELATPMPENLEWAKTLVSSQAEAKRDASVDVMGRASVGALEWWFDCLFEHSGENEKLVMEEAELLITRLCVADSVRKRFYAYRLKCLRRAIQRS